MSGGLGAFLAALMAEDEDEQRRRWQARSSAVVEAEPEADPIGDALRADAVAYWTMDEASGNRADATGRGNTLTPGNAPLGVAGKVGNAAKLVRASEQTLSKASSADVEVDDTDFTIALWVKLNSKPDWMSLINKVDPVEGLYEYDIAYDNNNDKFLFQTTESDVLLTTPATDTWYFIAVTWNKTTTRGMLRVNTDTNLTTNGMFPITSNDGEFVIGSESGFVHADADIDEVGFWKRILTADELDYLYNSGNGRTLYP